MFIKNKTRFKNCHPEAKLGIYRIVALQLLTMTLIVFFPLYGYCNNTWQLLYQPRQRIVKSIGVFKDKMFIGTGNGVLVSKDNGKTWDDFGSSQLLKDSSGNTFINWVYIDKEIGKIYIATSFGAYYSDINKPAWHKLFESTKTGSSQLNPITEEDSDLLNEGVDLSEIESNENDNSPNGQINSIETNKEKVYLSTNDGLWICTNDLENNCERLNQGLEPDNDSGNFQVNYVLKYNDDLLLAASNGVYIFDNKNLLWEKTTNGIEKLPGGKINARFLFVDKEQNLWLACGSGIYKSTNDRKSWEKKSYGIKTNADGFQGAFYFFEDKNNLYLASESGVYLLNKNEETWQDITGGIRTKESTKNVYFLAKLQENIYAATDEGLFVLEGEVAESEVAQPHLLKGKIEAGFASLGDLEPSVVEVQKQALKFASLPTSNDYKRYRLQARLRNLVPVVDFDANTTGTNSNYHQFENGISANTSLTNDYNAGKTKRFQHDGRSYKQVSVQWNTNQFVYDDEIWRILNQARLTANIKENLLDDVTRIYYQRRRLQLNNLLIPPEDSETKLTKELEIAELTGQLDSRTGGWFSREIEKRKQVTLKQ